jgi:3',5'-cyclic AMP phosphodiesterase CpdA
MLVAVAPKLGVSWFFNTEMWATGVWDQWAGYRTDHWREAMTEAITKSSPTTRPFLVDPGNIAADAPFSFIVIGDTGEGTSAQHALRDQFLALGNREDVKFLVLSSDVIYPQGAMHDYEPKFYLPFKGFTKPIYAIPGNHDWYDALEAFAANFLDADSARTAMRARLEADHRISSTTDAVIESHLKLAAFLRSEYGVKSGLQRGPYFELQTPHFALVGIDTGVVRRVDDPQFAWLRDVLDRSRGKTIMVVPGHPIYTAGYRVSDWDEDYKKLHDLLNEFDVRLVMAGDAHAMEFHREVRDASSTHPGKTLHVVNGGGGAYLSIGAALDWPAKPASPDYAIYPTRQQIVDKLDAQTPLWKKPLWVWAKRFHGWPASTEALAALFASGRAPFCQSFVLITVDPPAGVVRVKPYGVKGPLRWRDLGLGGAIQPPGTSPDDPAEFVVEMVK